MYELFQFIEWDLYEIKRWWCRLKGKYEGGLGLDLGYRRRCIRKLCRGLLPSVGTVLV